MDTYFIGQFLTYLQSCQWILSQLTILRTFVATMGNAFTKLLLLLPSSEDCLGACSLFFSSFFFSFCFQQKCIFFTVQQETFINWTDSTDALVLHEDLCLLCVRFLFIYFFKKRSMYLFSFYTPIPVALPPLLPFFPNTPPLIAQSRYSRESLVLPQRNVPYHLCGIS